MLVCSVLRLVLLPRLVLPGVRRSAPAALQRVQHHYRLHAHFSIRTHCSRLTFHSCLNLVLIKPRDVQSFLHSVIQCFVYTPTRIHLLLNEYRNLLIVNPPYIPFVTFLGFKIVANFITYVFYLCNHTVRSYNHVICNKRVAAIFLL